MASEVLCSGTGVSCLPFYCNRSNALFVLLLCIMVALCRVPPAAHLSCRECSGRGLFLKELFLASYYSAAPVSGFPRSLLVDVAVVAASGEPCTEWINMRDLRNWVVHVLKNVWCILADHCRFQWPWSILAKWTQGRRVQ